MITITTETRADHLAADTRRAVHPHDHGDSSGLQLLAADRPGAKW
ncbi:MULTISPECIES: hypothetical protein [unclassified Solwaraspora]|nr:MULTISPECIES: hypothetical protein [unclassified Solwaraspora]WBB95481.1 hypothetical protein O7553_19095 [Solwaraspora sp. WMMA2059]WBC20614.1 hypothetical protein O7543_28270 [Solwaraspora sp. WMMA2080]WJK37253.1 hypothetical protein O7610_13405 [Solwaraspora sp. WMMA2065]